MNDLETRLPGDTTSQARGLEDFQRELDTYHQNASTRIICTPGHETVFVESVTGKYFTIEIPPKYK